MPGILTVPMCIGCSFGLISAGAFPRPGAGGFSFDCLRRSLFFQQRQRGCSAPAGAGLFFWLSPTASFLSAAKRGHSALRRGSRSFFMPPAASFLSAAKEKRKRNAAKNYVFGFPRAASHGFYLVKISHANIVLREFHRNIALSLLLGALPLLL